MGCILWWGYSLTWLSSFFFSRSRPMLTSLFNRHWSIKVSDVLQIRFLSFFSITDGTILCSVSLDEHFLCCWCLRRNLCLVFRTRLILICCCRFVSLGLFDFSNRYRVCYFRSSMDLNRKNPQCNKGDSYANAILRTLSSFETDKAVNSFDRSSHLKSRLNTSQDEVSCF